MFRCQVITLCHRHFRIDSNSICIYVYISALAQNPYRGGEIMALHTVEWLEKDSGISKHTWRAWIRLGRVPVIRLGRRVRVAEEDYRRFLAENRVPAREGEGK